MVTAELTIIPIGTETSSVSAYLVAVPTVLKSFPNVVYEMSGMGTALQGDVDTIWQAVRAIQEAVFERGCGRVYTILKIDDRRDKASTLQSKLESVQQKL